MKIYFLSLFPPHSLSHSTCLSLQTSQHFLSEMSTIIAVSVWESLGAVSFPIQKCSFGLKSIRWKKEQAGETKRFKTSPLVYLFQ